MPDNVINHPYRAYIIPGKEEAWCNDTQDFNKKVEKAARNPGLHAANKHRFTLARTFLNLMNVIANPVQSFLNTLQEGIDMPEQAKDSALTDHLFSVKDTPPQHSLTDYHDAFFSGILERLNVLWYDPLLFPQASAEQARKNVINSNEIPSNNKPPLNRAATPKRLATQPAATRNFLIKPDMRAIDEFQDYYMKQHPANPLVLAKKAIEKVLFDKYHLCIDASHVWLHSFPLGESDPNTVTRFAHNMKPAHSERLDDLVLKNFSGEQWENEFSMNMLNGVYNQSEVETSRFGAHNEVRITPQQLMEEIWKLNFSQVYRSQLDAFWQKPRLQEMENLIVYIMSAARYLHNLQPEDREIFHKGWGLSKDKTGTVKRYFFDINGYPSTDIVILRRKNSPKVYIFDPRLENPFRVFQSEFDMKSWFINRCADAAERQKIAVAFPAASRVQGYFRWGVDRYLQAMGDPANDPNSYLKYIATDVKPLQGSLAILLADAQKKRAYADLPYEITSHGDVRKARWAIYFRTINIIFPNPATLIASWGMALDKMLNGVRWQDRKQAASEFFTDTAFLLLAALDGVVSRALDTGEEWLTAVGEEDGGLDAVLRTETEDLRNDYTQRLLAKKLGMESLPPELNVHNRPLRVYPAIEERVKAMQIMPVPVTFEELGPAEENGLFSGLGEGKQGKKFVQIKNEFYEVHYDEEAHEYYLGEKNAKRLPLYIDEENKVAFEKPFSAREINKSVALCRGRRAPGTSSGEACTVKISEKARQALDENIASALPAESIEDKLTIFNPRRALFKETGTDKIYFKYANHYFRTKINNPAGYIASFILKLKPKNVLKKLLHKSSVLELKLVPDRNSPSGMTLAMNDEVKEILLNLKRGGLPIVESYIEQEKNLSREEISAITQYVNSSSNAIREFCIKKKLVGPEVYHVKWLQQEAEYALKYIKSGLAKIKPYEGRVYHGGSIKQELLNKLQPGDYISNAAFLSASEDKSIALLHQPEASKLYAGTRQVLLDIESKYRGHSVMKYSGKQYEKEVVFEDNSLFRVKAVNKESGVLTLEEVPVAEMPANKVIYYFDDWLLMEQDSGSLHRFRPANS